MNRIRDWRRGEREREREREGGGGGGGKGRGAPGVEYRLFKRK